MSDEWIGFCFGVVVGFAVWSIYEHTPLPFLCGIVGLVITAKIDAHLSKEESQ